MLLVTLTYVCIQLGVYDATGRFWRALFWPHLLGKIIAHEAMKREEPSK